MTKYEVQQEFMADYESMKSKFQILDTFNHFYKNVEYNMKLCLMKNNRFLLFRYEIHSTFYLSMDIWQIKNGDVPDLATSLYHIAYYNYINHKFQILDTFIKF